MAVCSKCGSQIIEDTINPNIHYSKPKKICEYCKRKESAKPGTWLQDEKGNYYQKDT